MTLVTGTRIGQYEIVALIGVGGMGEVYRAQDTRLGRQVALKILPHDASSDAVRRDRLEREARTLAALNHPHIAQLYGFEESTDARALVMELVEGLTLAERLAQSGRFAVDEAVAIARQIADAFETAHEQGIVHRDLKPSNVKIREDGTVEGAGFRTGQGARSVGGERRGGHELTDTYGAQRRSRDDCGDRRVHGARAGAREIRRPPRRHLGLRRGALRNAHRQACLRGS